MATELLLPDAVITATNLGIAVPGEAGFGFLIDRVNEGVDNFDDIYAINQGENANTLLVLSFPTPSGDLTLGAGLQTFRARVRKNATGGNNPTVRIEVREGGTIRANSGNTTVTSLTGVDITFTWDASVLNLQDGSNAEIGIAQQAGGSGGNPNNRRWIETDAADWTADYIEVVGGAGYSFSTLF
jgi:hypothetical protein